MIAGISRKINNCYLSFSYSNEHKITTHLTDAEKIMLVKLARSINGESLCEIGSYLGASSCFIAAGISKKGRDAKLYCVDTWENDAMTEGKKETFDTFLKNTSKYRDLIVPLRGTSSEIAKSFSKQIDFIFIDGDHSYEGVKADVDAWFPKLNNNALVVFHDIGWAEGVQKVVREEVASRAKRQGRLPNLYWAWL